MIALFTDFGSSGIYTGQMEAVLSTVRPGVPVVDLCNDAPVFKPRAAGSLLSALALRMPRDTIFVCVVDPGVGGNRRALTVRTGRYWFVGPDNGLLALVARMSGRCSVRTIDWSPDVLSDTFHGRDLFAPVAASIARGEVVPGTPVERESMAGFDWPLDHYEIIYIDHYGNLFTGIRASSIGRDEWLTLNGNSYKYQRTFSHADPAQPFWYVNSIGLVEIAVNSGHAGDLLGVRVGDAVRRSGTDTHLT
ncbi:MAG: SAM-dependent chlorinase/fluorinase [Gammaproteobacteria bacterium]|nr:SAM-dependent chlorinase/fluorinase [Gammaproteobacteria bacterium]